MAEVLITLVVIGVVAAITIPVISSNNEKRQLYAQFMKSYNTITNALTLATIDHGEPSKWKTHNDGNYEYLNTYILPYLKNGDTSQSLSELLETNYKDLSGGSRTTELQMAKSDVKTAVVLPGGAVVFEFYGKIYIDVNGRKKPNVFGRDSFPIELADQYCSNNGHPFCSSSTPADCTGSKSFSYDGCYKKLLNDGKMSY